jgi:TetR/AcrR family transcriptional regulator, lmrAB and yxaGH operons repressor
MYAYIHSNILSPTYATMQAMSNVVALAAPSALPARARENHREVMVRTTARLLPSKGLAGLSLVEVARITGAPRGSLYHYFPGGWEELVRDALSLAEAHAVAFLEALPITSQDPAGLVRAMGEGFKAGVKKTRFEGGCPIASASLSAGEGDEAIRSQCAAIYAHWIAALQARFVTLGMEETAAHDYAQVMLDTFEGALLRTRAMRSLAPLDSAIENLIKLLRA